MEREGNANNYILFCCAATVQGDVPQWQQQHSSHNMGILSRPKRPAILYFTEIKITAASIRGLVLHCSLQ
jgi:hypothetical protein